MKAKPTHYKVIAISTYTRDLAELDAKVEALKARGYPRASRSQLIRLAVASLDIDRLTGAIDTVPSLEAVPA